VGVDRVTGVLKRPKVIVLGLMTKSPVAGVVWQTVHYLLGLELLGCEPYYVEAHARAPGMFTGPDDDGAERAAGFIAGVMRRFDLSDRWAYHALHSDGRVYGLSDHELRKLYSDAALIINLSGGTRPLPEHSATGRLVFLETDPVRLQIELSENDAEASAFLEPHHAFYTFAENLGTPQCALPVSERFTFTATRQPVVVEHWERHGIASLGAFTTVGNWRQRRRDVEFAGETYFWSKHHEFMKFLDLPARTGRTFEVALARYQDADRRRLESHGWLVRDAADVSKDADTYRRFICASEAEFTVAKDQNVRFRTGWFSDRSATYLAAGRPVITQDTGFGRVLPTGAGLFAFSSTDDVLAAVDAFEAQYTMHSQAAAEIARAYFAHDVVLRPILDDLGVCIRPPRTSRTAERSPFPDDLELRPASRRPMRLHASTVETVLGSPLPERTGGPYRSDPRASIVVVTYNNLVFTRMCLESLLAHTQDVAHEVVVIDNASTDGTTQYLLDLAQRCPELRVHFNSSNAGFPAANNRGLAEARGDVLVLLNNDTIPAPGWLSGLVRHLDDPRVGLVGPVTNRACNEAQIEVPYATLGEFVSFARERSGAHIPSAWDIRMLAMFCTAMRREVFESVGPLDERFGVGTLEDEDYAVRVREAGYRVVCAEDVFVHHFGHASFDELAASGDYQRLLARNRSLFEQKWGVRWEPYARRRTEAYTALTQRVHDAIANTIPAGASVAVVSKGDDELLPFDGHPARHFPSTVDGTYAGAHPSGDDEAIRALETIRARGVAYLVIPNSSLWWLDHYAGFREHLTRRYRTVHDDADTCVVYALEAG
jgi:GT2 family glycosyltransferase